MVGHITRPRGKPRQCAYCDRIFTKEEHLKRHERTHTGERPFKCSKCGKTYARSDVLFRHSQSHTSTCDNDHNGEQLRGLSSGIVMQDDDTIPQSSYMLSSPNLARQPRTPFQHSIPSAHSFIDQPLPYHGSSGPSFTMTTSSAQSEEEDLSHSDPNAPELRDHNTMNHLIAFMSHDPFGDSYEVSGQAQEGRACEANSQRPQKRLRLSLHSLQNNNTGSEGLTISHLSQPQFDFHLPSASYIAETKQGCLSEHFDSLDMFDFDLCQIPDPSGMELDLDDMYRLDCDSSSLQPLTPTATTSPCNNTPNNNTFLTISSGQTQNVQRIWSEQRPKLPLPIIDELWSEVAIHKADNIFTKPQLDLNLGSSQYLGCKMDHECRRLLVQHCKELDGPVGLLTDTVDNSMPDVDILDSSLDFYFQFFHPILPFIHKSTFDAKNTSSPLLLAMCLVGLSYLDGKRTKDFLIRYLKKLFPACFISLTSTEATASHSLTTLATVLIVAYLALGFRDEIDIYQSYALCTQTLRLADARGIFTTKDGDKPIIRIEHETIYSESMWKAWGRVESVKRLICCLIYLDMAYSRLMNASGVIDIDKVDIHLPCDDSLFDDVTTAAAFQRCIQQGEQVTMPQVKIRDFQVTTALLKMNQSSTQILLRSLYLRITAANIRLSNQHCQKSPLRPTSLVERLAMDESSKVIISNLIQLPKMQSHFLEGKQQNNALGWHYLCILLTADIDILEIACGRDGLDAAESSLIHVFAWSQSSSARRALLHAAQVFNMLNLCHIRESYLTRPDLVLFVSALVISQYFLVVGHGSVGFDVPVFELLHDIDWTTLGDEGFGTATGCVNMTVTEGEGKLTPKSLREFLKNGGPVSFAGEAQGLGGVTAKKIARKFAHVMDRFGEWDGFSHSRLLRAICGFTNGLD